MFNVISDHVLIHWKDYFPNIELPHKLQPLFMRGDKWNMLYLFDGRDKEPLCVIEIASGESALLRQASKNMKFMSTMPQLSRFCPKVYYFGRLGNEDALIQEFCRGLPMLFLLQRWAEASQSKEITNYVLLATEFLIKFHSQTKSEIYLDKKALNDFFNPLINFAVKNSKISDILNTLENKHLPLVMSHNDYIPSNILVDRKGNIKIIDWEYATFNSLPLTDLFNFLLWSYRDIKKSDKQLCPFIKELYLSDNFLSKAIKEAIKAYCKQMNIDRNMAIAIFLFWASAKLKSDKCLNDFLSYSDALFDYI